MTIRMLASGTLFNAPVRRKSAAGKAFTTAKLRSGTGGEEGALWISLVGFGDLADALAELGDRADVSVSGRGELSVYVDKSGEHRVGVSIVVDQLLTLARRKPKKATKAAAMAGGDPFADDPLDERDLPTAGPDL
jgi:single-stranded DNA-binding protein